MAETVKKSRIVSERDEDLEEALMEEFNMRLKSCMSQDDLQQNCEKVGNDYSIVDFKDLKTTDDFIKSEQKNSYVERKIHNGKHKNEDKDNIYENLTHQYIKTDCIKTANEETIAVDADNREYEDVDQAKPYLTLTDLSEKFEENDGLKSVKDRMLLSTDTAPCLLFTQTVTSPMLTPSEENIDFLKGFREAVVRDEPPVPGDLYENLIISDNIYENINNGVGTIAETAEAIYQNVDELRQEIKMEVDLSKVNENVYEANPEPTERAIYQNVDELKQAANHFNIIDENNKSYKSTKLNEHANEEQPETNKEIEGRGDRIIESTQVTESYVETTTVESTSHSDKGLKKKKSKKSRKEEKENISVKSSFNKFDALQKKNVLHIRSTDSSKAQEKFNGASIESANCRSCDKAVFQMEQIKAEKAIWHKNCFRCKECNKQLNVDTYQSHEGTVYCKPHFKALFAPKAIEDDAPSKPRKPELIIRENQPLELPPDVVRASDKPDLGLEELQSLNVKERFQVFEQHQSVDLERTSSAVNVKKSPSILSKLARFQAKGMDIGVADESLNGIPIEESTSEEEAEEEELDSEDADLIRAKKVQKEKPFHFTGMSDVKNRWEQGEQNLGRDERREERKQEIQSIRNRLFMGKQGKMKEAYQQAIIESESCTNLIKEQIEVGDTKTLKERFEKGEMVNESDDNEKETDDIEVFESEISKNSRSLFLELDANASKAPQFTAALTPKLDVKKAREAYLSKTSSEDVIKSSTELVEDVQIRTADIQQRFKFFETYKEPEQTKKSFRITPPREGQVKASTPEKEIYRDPEVARSEEIVEDSVVAEQAHTATKMLNKFRQMEEDLVKEPQPSGPKPLKRFTPPPEPVRSESNSDVESGSEEESEEEDVVDRSKVQDEDLLEAQKTARAKQLRAKFEKWEANEIKREQNNGAVNVIEEFGEDQSQIESTKSLRARFESMREITTESNRTPRVKVNRFIDLPNVTETCESCNSRVYPLEKISVHNHIYHKGCFKCMECSCVLRMDSYSYNQGLLYCTPHFKRLFISKGNYETGFGLDQHKEKWNATPA